MSVRPRALRRPLAVLVAAALTLTGSAVTLALTERAADAALDTRLYAVGADQKIYSFNESTGVPTALSSPVGFQSAAIARQPGTNLLYIYEQTANASGNYRIVTYNVSTLAVTPLSSTFRVGLLRLGFRSDGELYGGVNNQLYHLDKTTGAILSTTTLTGLANGGGDLTFGADNTMYVVVNSTLATFAPFAVTPPATLVATSTVTITPGTNAHPGLSFGKTGKLFTVDSSTAGGATVSSLTYVNPATGAETKFPSTGISFLDLTAAPDQAPVAGAIGPLSTPRDTPVTADVTVGSSDGDGDPVTVQSATALTNGTLTYSTANGTVTFTPTRGFSGPATYSFTLTDGNGGTATKTVTVNVGPNTNPVAVNDTFSIGLGAAATAVPVLANDTDANGDTLSVTSFTAATHGTVALTGGVITYKPAAGYSGPDSFTYTISDGFGGTDTASVAVTVTKPNSNPVYTGATTNQTQTIPAAGTPVALAATDADGDPLTFTLTSGTLPAGITLNSNGTFSGSATGIGGSTVTIVVKDGKGGSASTTLTITVQNGPPVAVADSVSTPRSTAVVVSPLTNDTDPNGDPRTLVSASSGTAGVGLSVDVAAGTVTYTPKAGFVGTDTFTYVISDGRGATATGTVTVTVTSVNSAPAFTSTSNNTLQVIDPNGAVAALTATDPDGDPLTYSAGALPDSLVLNPNGTFSGAATTAGDFPATITVSDGKLSTSQTLTIRVRNLPPTPADDAFSTPTNTAVTSAVRWNDTDPNGGSVVVSSVTQPSNGTVVIDQASGNPTYTPRSGFTGTDTYTYTVTDPGGLTGTATVTMTVGNAPPVFTSDPTNTSQTVSPGSLPSPLAATDANNDTLTYVRVGGTLPPGITLGGNGTFSGLASTSGRYTSTVEVRDGRGGVGTTTLVLTVPNAAPVAVADRVSTPAGTPVLTDVRFNDTDANGDPLVITAAGGARNGTVAQDATTGNPTYTPNAGFAGTDTYTYTVSDGFGGTDTGTVTVTVGNAAPSFTNDGQNTAQAVQPRFTPLKVIATDPNGDTLTYALVSGPLPGSVVLAPDGTFSGVVTTAGTYTLRISADDGKGGVATTTLVIDVPNLPPTAVADTVNVAYGGATSTDVRFNDTDPNGDTLTVVSFSQGTQGGAVTGGPAGTVTYNAKAGFSGTDTYTYTVSDGQGGTSSGTVTVKVGNGAPAYTNAPSNSAQTVSPGQTPVALAAADPNGDALTYTLTSGALPNGVALSAAGVFSGSPTTAGSYTVTVVVSDGNGGSASTQLTITVPNVRPVAIDDAASTAYATPVDVLVLSNDSDANGDALTITTATNGSRGTVVVNAGQTVTYTPATGFSGVDTFTYTVTDGITAPRTATVTITVANAPPAFTSAGTNSAQTVQPGAAPVQLLATDANGDPLTYALASGTPPAGVGLNPDGTFSGAVQKAGTFIVTVSVTDRRGTPVPQQLTLTVPNLPPTAAADSDSTGYAMPATTDVLANDTDPNGDPLTVTGVTDGSRGTVALDGAGMPVYTPAAGFSGVDSYTYTVSDGTNPVTGTVTVRVGNGAPTYTSAGTNTQQDVEPTATPTRVAATDPNGDPLTYAVASGALPAGVTLNADGSFAGSPSTAGSYTVGITVDDGKGGSATTSLVIRVPNRAPVAAPDTAGTAYRTPVATVVRFNDRDPNGDSLTVTATTDGANGTVSLNAAGNPVYTPAAGFSGVDSYGYTVSDPGLLTSSSTVTVTVGDAAPAYTAGPTQSQTVQPGSAPTQLLVTDPNAGDVLTHALTGGALPVGVTLNNDGSFAGAARASGRSTAQITVSDGKGGSDVTTLTIDVPNVGPTAVDDTDTTATATPVTTDVVANDTDPNGDALTVASFSQGSNGTVVRAGRGLSYTPVAGFAGFDSYTYTAVDPGGKSSPATVTIAVGNAPPAFTSDPSNSAQRVQPGSVPVPLQAADPNNDPLTYRIAAGTLPRRMSLNPDGSFTGPATAAGTYTVSAEVADPSGATDTVVLTLTVPNVAPVAVDDASPTAAQTPVETAVRANDRDPNGDPLTVTIVTQPINGTVTLSGTTGDPIYTPNNGFAGDDSYTYRVADTAGLVSNVATVRISVGNAPPSYTGDSENTLQSVQPGTTPLRLAVTDPNPTDTLTFSLAGGALPPGVTLGADGRFSGGATTAATYTATIAVDDGHLGRATTSLTIVVLQAPPVAVDDNAATTYVTPVTTTVLDNDTDPNGDALTVTGVGTAMNGSVSFTASSTTYRPAPGFSGSDSYDYTVTDIAGNSRQATVHVTVGNAQPVFTSPATQALQPGDTPAPVTATDPNVGDVVTYTLDPADVLPQGVSFDGQNGLFTGSVRKAGTFTLHLTADDGNGGTATQVLVLTVANVGPVANADSYPVVFQTARTVDPRTNDTDANGDALTVTAVGVAAHGTTAFTATGVTYTPANGYSGADSFSYTVSDGAGSATATVTVDVANAPPAFTAAPTNSAQTVLPGATPTAVIALDPNPTDTLTYTLLTGALPVGLALAADGSFTGTAKAAGDFPVTIQVSDGHLGTDTIGLRLQVPNVAPVALDDAASTGTGQPVTATVTANDSDPNGDALSVLSTTAPRNGSVVINGASVTYTPAAAFAGTDTFDYTVRDTGSPALTATATVTITVDNAPPVFTGFGGNTAQDVAPRATPAPVVATDANNDRLTYTLTSGQLPVGVTLNPDGSFSGTVAKAGTFRVTITVTDPSGASAVTTLVITVDNVAPVAVDDTATTAYSTAVTTDLLANDSDVNGDALSVVVLSNPTHGTVGLTAGRATYTPFAGYAGPDSYDYTVSDGQLSDTATVRVAVSNGAPAFTAAPTNRAQTVQQGTTAASLAATDPNGDALTYSVSAGSAPAGLTLSPDGTWTGTPSGPGVTTFDVTVSDGSLTDTVSLTITVPSTPPVLAAGPDIDVTVAAGATPPPLVGAVFGGGIPTYAQTGGSLPAGVTLRPDGTFAGVVGPVGTWTISITVTSPGAPPTAGTVTIHVPNTPPTFTPTPTNTAQTVVAGETFASLGATDANGDPVTYAVTAGTLPPGVTLNPDGSFSGTAMPVGTWTVTVTVTDSHGASTSAPLTLTVPNSPPALVAAPMTIDPGSTPPPLAGTDPNGDPLTYTVTSGALPPGLTLGPNGTFSGSPTTGGSYPFSVTVTDSHNASVTVPTALTVPAAPPSVSPSPSLSPSPATSSSPSPSPVVTPSATALPPTASPVAGPSPSSPPPAPKPVLTPTSTPTPTPAAQTLDQSRSTGLDQPIAVDLTGRSGASVGLRVVNGPSHGTVVLRSDGTALYTPDRGFSGVDAFTYAFTGGSGEPVTGIMHIRVGTGLPRTGAETGQALGAGLGLLVFGFLLVILGRRRTEDDEKA